MQRSLQMWNCTFWICSQFVVRSSWTVNGFRIVADRGLQADQSAVFLPPGSIHRSSAVNDSHHYLRWETSSFIHFRAGCLPVSKPPLHRRKKTNPKRSFIESIPFFLRLVMYDDALILCARFSCRQLCKTGTEVGTQHVISSAWQTRLQTALASCSQHRTVANRLLIYWAVWSTIIFRSIVSNVLT